MQERLGFWRARARIRGFAPSTFGGPFRRIKDVAAITVAAFFLASTPALGTIPSTPAAIAPAERGPALWIVQDGDTIIYLFGTFHALDGRSNWFTHSVRAAFDASDELVLETLVPEDPAELHAVLARHSLAGEPKVGEPVVPADRAPSFVASAGQAMSAGHAMGMSVDQGADAVLRRAAGTNGKPVAGLESFEFQLAMFGRLPAAPTNASPRASGGDLGGLLGGMQAAWKRGDNDEFAVILGNVRIQSPQAYKMLFADRNANWAGWIANRMTRPGTVFVAVGTGHLVGPDSVQSQLAARGIRSARIS